MSDFASEASAAGLSRLQAIIDATAARESAVNQIRSAIDVLCQPHAAHGVIELRALEVNSDRFPESHSGFYDADHLDRMAEDAYRLTTQGKARGVYFALNPVDRRLLARSCNRSRKVGKGESVADANITRRVWLAVDIDAKRPSGISATDDERKAASDLGGEVRSFLEGSGFPSPIEIDSGNGLHLYWRVDLANDDTAKPLVQHCLSALAARFNSDVVAVDTSVFNAARIMKLAGTWVRKGDDTPDRPHRVSKLLDVPDERLIVPLKALQELADKAQHRKPPPSPSANGSTYHETATYDAAAWTGEEKAKRCRAYMKKVTGAVSGNGGHNATYKAARYIWADFAIDEPDAWTILQEWNATCQPPWEDLDLRHKLDDVIKAGGPRGEKLGTPPQRRNHSPAAHETSSAASPPGSGRDFGDLGEPSDGVEWTQSLKAETCQEYMRWTFEKDTKDIPREQIPGLAAETIYKGFAVEEPDARRLLHSFLAGDFDGAFDVSELDRALDDVIASGSERGAKLGDPPGLKKAAVTLRVIDSPAFFAQEFVDHYIIKNILPASQPTILGGLPKTLKTNFALDLSVSAATGSPFLGFEVVKPVVVLFFSGESGKATIQGAARRIACAKGVDITSAPIHWSFVAPKLPAPDQMTALKSLVKGLKAGLVVIDPLYLSLLDAESAGQASNLFAMGARLVELSSIVEETGSAIVLVHHFRKGNGLDAKYEPADLEQLSMSGVAEWARSWLLLSRREAWAPGAPHRLWLNCGGSAGHAAQLALDVDEGDPESPHGRFWTVTVEDAADARTRVKESKLRANAARVMTRLGVERSPVSKRQLREALSLGAAAITAALEHLVSRDLVQTGRGPRGRQQVDLYGLKKHGDPAGWSAPPVVDAALGGQP